jgi:hypothetical protein
MTKVRDIAAFLGKTEALNTTNKTLAFDSGSVTTLTQSVADDIINSNGLVVYSTVDSLPASPNDGDRAWVTGNNKFYVADSSWHNSLLINTPPSIDILNYDSDLNDSQSLSMTIQVTDSFENLDIITYNAVISPSNIDDSAVETFSLDSSVLSLHMRPDTIDGVRNFQVTFTANDQVNVSTSVKDFTVSPPFSTGTLVSSVSAINEGSSVTFTLPTTGYANGATFPYTITGISAADLNPQTLSGNMVVSGSSATKTITARSDNTTEGAETMTFSADDQSVDVTINDTSLSPATYSVSKTSTSVNEGSYQYISIVYTNHTGGTISCSFTPTGSTEVSQVAAISNCTVSSVSLSSGTFNLALTGQSGTAQIRLTHYADNTLDGDATARVTFGSPISSNSGNYTVVDTSYPICGCYGLSSGLSSGYDSISFQFHRNALGSYVGGYRSNFQYGSNNTNGLEDGGTTGLNDSNKRYWKTVIFKTGGTSGTDVGYFTWNNPLNIWFGTNTSGLLTNVFFNNALSNGNLQPTSSGGWSQNLSSLTSSYTYVRFTFDTLSFHSSNYSSAASYNRYNQFYLFDGS